MWVFVEQFDTLLEKCSPRHVDWISAPSRETIEDLRKLVQDPYVADRCGEEWVRDKNAACAAMIQEWEEYPEKKEAYEATLRHLQKNGCGGDDRLFAVEVGCNRGEPAEIVNASPAPLRALVYHTVAAGRLKTSLQPSNQLVSRLRPSSDLFVGPLYVLVEMFNLNRPMIMAANTHKNPATSFASWTWNLIGVPVLLEGVDVELFSMVWSRDNLNSPMEGLAGLARALTRAGRGNFEQGPG